MKILIAGDFVPQNRVIPIIENGQYSEILGEVKPVVESADYAIVNLEAPVIYGSPSPISKTGPNLSCSENAIKALKWAGFDCVTLANNHFFDQGKQGVNGTIETCEKYGMSFVGGGRNLREAEMVLYNKVGEKILAIVNCCEQEWSIATELKGGSNPLNPIKQYYAIKEAKKNADYVIAIVHGGIEMYQYPTLRMQETYRFFIDAGADAVVNHHQHCYSGYEVYHNKPIFYGLGNFCFDREKSVGDNWNRGYMIMLQFNKEIDIEVLPYTQSEDNIYVHLLDDSQMKDFVSSLAAINNALSDQTKLVSLFDEYCNSISKRKFIDLEPISNRYLRFLQRLSIFPRLFKGRNERNWLCRLNCESHRDVLLRIIKKDLEI